MRTLLFYITLMWFLRIEVVECETLNVANYRLEIAFLPAVLFLVIQIIAVSGQHISST